jgi:hypothetical protein
LPPIGQTKYHPEKEMVSRGSLPLGNSWPLDPDKKFKKKHQMRNNIYYNIAFHLRLHPDKHYL